MAAISLQVVQDIGHVHDVVQHHHLGDPIPILASLFLFHRVTAAQDWPTKGEPIRALVIRFDFGRFRSDMLAHRPIGHVRQKDDGPLNTTYFAPRSVKMIAPALHAEFLPEHGRQHLTGLNRQDHLHHILSIALDEVPIDHPNQQAVNRYYP